MNFRVQQPELPHAHQGAYGLIVVWGLILALGFSSASGCYDSAGLRGEPELIWGQQGIAPGRLQKPRAMAIDTQDNLYLVDITARIQVFDVDGRYLLGWRTPASQNGRPTGLGISRTGKLLVADTHYYRLLVYELDGRPLEDATIGGTLGNKPGEFGFVTDVVDDSQGNLYVAEYGDWDRVQKFSPKGNFLLQWGSHGEQPGQFRRPQNLAIDSRDRIWVADACNHRIQVFDTMGRLLWYWGEQGREPGQLYYPYDLIVLENRTGGLGDDQGQVIVCEYGNHRLQKFTFSGKSLSCWGTHGRQPGQLHNPWALVHDSQGRIHVLDSNNNRVQRIVW
jgi:DNA-binding beta-propeller fold protein YncE